MEEEGCGGPRPEAWAVGVGVLAGCRGYMLPWALCVQQEQEWVRAAESGDGTMDRERGLGS